MAEVNSAFCRAFAIGSSISIESKGARITVIAHCNLFTNIDFHTYKRTYTVKLNGSSIGTITLIWKSERYGGAGYGRKLNIELSGFIFVSKAISKGDTLQVTGTENDDDVISEYAEVMVC